MLPRGMKSLAGWLACAAGPLLASAPPLQAQTLSSPSRAAPPYLPAVAPSSLLAAPPPAVPSAPPAPQAQAAASDSPASDSPASDSSASDSSASQAAAPLTVQEAVRLSLQRHPQVLAARENERVADAGIGLSRAPWLPQLTSNTLVRGTYSYQTGINPVYLDAMNQPCTPGSSPSCQNVARAPDTSAFNYSSALNLSQTIYDFGRTQYNIAQARAQAAAQRGDTAALRQQIALGAATAFYNVLLADSVQRIADATLLQQQERLRQAEGFFAVGTRAEIDVLTQRTAVAQAQLQKVHADNAVRLSRVQLQLAMGGGDQAFGPLVDPPERPQPLAEEAQALKQLIDDVVERRPEVAAQRDRVAAAEANLKSVRANYWPILSLNGSAQLGGVLGSSGAAQSSGVLAVGTNSSPLLALTGTVQLTWPILSGLSTLYGVRQADAQLGAARAQLESQRQQVRASLQQALLQIVENRRALEAADTVARQAELQLKTAEGRYRAGVGSIIEVTDAQSGATSARMQRVQAGFNLLSARAALLVQLGRLDRLEQIEGTP